MPWGWVVRSFGNSVEFDSIYFGEKDAKSNPFGFQIVTMKKHRQVSNSQNRRAPNNSNY